MQAQVCPVCNGTGKLEKKQCHGCNGKGWVEVGESINPPTYPYYPWEYPPYFYVTYTSSYSC